MAEGPIMLGARAYIPQTWDALSRTSVFGSELLQLRGDTVKYRVFGAVVDPSAEAATYNPLTIDYASKLIALAVIPPGTDYWADQLTAESTNQNENISYPDRISTLWRIHARLLVEVDDLKAEFERLFGRVARRRVSLPTVSPMGPLVTAGGAHFPALHATTAYGLLPWVPDTWVMPWLPGVDGVVA